MTTEEILQQCRVEGQLVYLPDVILDYQSEYTPIKKKLELIGGKWKGGKTSAFVFSEDPTDLLAAIQNGEQVNLKKEFQFFPTPEEVGLKMMSLAPALRPDMKILEPSAGDGALIHCIHTYAPFGNLKVDCFELMELNRIRLEKNSNARIIGNDFLEAVAADTMNLIRGQYDLVVANPPFSKNQDIDHIRAMFECLKPGGTIVTMAGPSWKTGSQKKQVQFKEWLVELGADIIEVDAGAFKDSGTMIGTLILVIKKPAGQSVLDPAQLSEIETKLEEAKILADKYISSLEDYSKSKNEEAAIQSETFAVQMTDEIEPEAASEDNQVGIDQLKELSDSNTRRRISLDLTNQTLGQAINTLLQSSEKLTYTSTETDMSFFSQLAALLGQAEISLTVKAKDDNLTVMIMPKGATQLDKVKPLILSGSATDLDQDFFTTVSGSIQKMTGIVSNVTEVEKSLDGAATPSVDAKPTKSRKSRKDAKEDEPAAEPVAVAPAETTEEPTQEETPLEEQYKEPEVDQAELDRIANEAKITERQERCAKVEELQAQANEHFENKRFEEAKNCYIEAQQFADNPAAAEADIQKCNAEIERIDKFNMLVLKSAEFAEAKDWKNAAGALKQAKNFSSDPDTLDEKIKDYIQKSIEAAMESEEPSYL